MKRLINCLLLFIACTFSLPADRAVAQSTNTPNSRHSQEQSLQELVSEVRQLRATLQRINVVVYRGHVMLERLKIQHEQVARLSRELTSIREDMSELRAHLAKMREMSKRAESGVEVGIKQPDELMGLRAEIENASQREQRMLTRETQLANDLELERAKLNDLNDRLNALELEMTPR